MRVFYFKSRSTVIGLVICSFMLFLVYIKPSKSVFKGLNNRLEFGDLMETLKFTSMIEIGVRSGEFTSGVLDRWPSFEQYSGIDHWSENKLLDNLPSLFEQARVTLEKFGKRVQLIKGYSYNVVNKFNDSSIDFIYIDAKHDFCSVYHDLELYYPKLKCGGVVAGGNYVTAIEGVNHDWLVCSFNGSEVLLNGGGPKGAVIEFAKVHNIKAADIKTTLEPYFKSYYFFKNCDNLS